MKKKYEKPIIELVEFEVNEAIAGNCKGERLPGENATEAACIDIGVGKQYADDGSCDVVIECYNTFLNNINS